jgi:hypothetical protein
MKLPTSIAQSIMETTCCWLKASSSSRRSPLTHQNPWLQTTTPVVVPGHIFYNLHTSQPIHLLLRLLRPDQPSVAALWSVGPLVGKRQSDILPELEAVLLVQSLPKHRALNNSIETKFVSLVDSPFNQQAADAHALVLRVDNANVQVDGVAAGEFEVSHSVAVELGHQVLAVSLLLVVVPEVALCFRGCRESVAEDVPFGEAGDVSGVFVDGFQVEGVWVGVFGFDEPLRACRGEGTWRPRRVRCF